MLNRATAAWVAFALAGVVIPGAAAAQATDAAGAAGPVVDAPATPDSDAAAAVAQANNAVRAAEPAVDAPAPPESDAAAAGDGVGELTKWVLASGDNNGAPFIVIDKVGAKVFVFDSQGLLVGATPALLGVARGDDSAPGVGARKLSAISVDERTTPAGRFIAKIGTASGNHQVLWVDYATSISLHPVVTANKKERRLQRLASPTSEDNRITYGCINVPAAFYGEVVRPLFKDQAGVVYILPETKALAEVFQTFHAQEQPAPLAGISH